MKLMYSIHSGGVKASLSFEVDPDYLSLLSLSDEEQALMRESHAETLEAMSLNIHLPQKAPRLLAELHQLLHQNLVDQTYALLSEKLKEEIDKYSETKDLNITIHNKGVPVTAVIDRDGSDHINAVVFNDRDSVTNGKGERGTDDERE